MNATDLIFSVIAAAAGVLFVLLLLRHAWKTTRRRVEARRRERARPDELATLRAERDRLRAAQAILRQQLEERIAEYRAEKVAFEAEAVRLRNDLGETQEDLQKANEEIARKAKDIARLKEIVANLEKDLEARTRELNETRNRLRQREAAMEELEKAHAALKRERNRLVHRLEEALSRQAALEKKLDARDAELAALKAQTLRAQPPEKDEKTARVVSLTEASLRKGRTAQAAGNKGEETDGLLGQVIALDRLAAALGRKAKDKPAMAAETTAAGAAGQEAADIDMSQLKEELERLDALWKERLEALRKAADGPSTAQGKES